MKDVEQLSTDIDGNNINKLEMSKSVEVRLNIDSNKILRDDCQIMDSPGCDIKNVILKYIQNESVGADIFMFVMFQKFE